MTGSFEAEGEDLRVTTRREGDAMVLSAQGEVTVFSSPTLREAIRQIAAEKPPRLIFDLADTSYIDSSGVATLVEALQVVNRYRGKLVLAGMNPRVRGVFEIARLHTVFLVASNVQEALKA